MIRAIGLGLGALFLYCAYKLTQADGGTTADPIDKAVPPKPTGGSGTGTPVHGHTG